MLGDKGTVSQGDEHISELTLIVGGLRGNEKHLVGDTLGKLACQNGIRPCDFVLDMDGHVNHAIGIKHTNIAILAVVLGKGSGSDIHTLAYLCGGHLYAARHRGIKCQELGGTSVLVIVHTNRGKVFLVLTFTHDQGRCGFKVIALSHLGIINGCLNTQIQVRSCIVNGIICIVRNTVGQVNKSIDNVDTIRIRHIEVHSFVGIQILVCMQGLLALIEQHQLVVINGNAHAQSLSHLLGGRPALFARIRDGQATVACLGKQFRRIEHQGAVCFSRSNDAISVVLQLSVQIELATLQGEGVGFSTAQYLFDAIDGRIFFKIGKLGRGEFHAYHRGRLFGGGFSRCFVGFCVLALGGICVNDGDGVGGIGVTLGRATRTGCHNQSCCHHQKQKGDKRQLQQTSFFHEYTPFKYKTAHKG